MFLQLLASYSGFGNLPYPLWIVLVSLVVALLVDGWRRWRNRGFKDHRDSRQRPAPTWPLRPSNILILLGAGFLIYKGLYNPWWDNFRYSASIGALIVALAFVIRQWEDESAREIDEVDSDEETGGDSPRKE